MCGKLRDQPPPTLLPHQLLPQGQATLQLAGDEGGGGGGGGGGWSDAGLVRTFTCLVMEGCHVCCHVVVMTLGPCH